mmetsp:Transcript_43970/g.72685  ORF Transcript_43970/g.72685 Transcript_43970/m.72685 type:complete len:206 (-) Transcript_43970:367-984(-)
MLANFHRIGRDKGRVSNIHIHVVDIRKSLARVVMRNLAANTTYAFHYFLKIHNQFTTTALNLETKFLRAHNNIIRHFSAAQNSFTRHTTKIETIAAKHMLLDNRHSTAQASCTGRRHQTSSTRTNRHQIIFWLWLWRYPFHRVHIVEELLVVLVHWSNTKRVFRRQLYRIHRALHVCVQWVRSWLQRIFSLLLLVAAFAWNEIAP